MNRMNILISFYYFEKIDLDDFLGERFSEVPNVFADSGAYSAWSQGGDVDVAKYGDWLLKWNKYFEVRANLDVKGGTPKHIKQQEKNLRYLESKGLDILPVYHIGEPWDLLVDMCQEYDYIGLGGIAGRLPKYEILLRNFVKVFQISQEHNTVLHGFGMTRIKMLKIFPWYTVDSTSWATGFMWGRLPVFNPRTGKYITLVLGDKDQWHRNWELVERYGYNPQDFIDRTYESEELNGLGMQAYIALQEWLRKRHGVVKCPGKRDGIIIYLADSSLAQLPKASLQFDKFVKGKGVMNRL